jgi:hypothetical protein
MEKETKVVERKLGRENAWGIADTETKIIELDPRMKPRKYMEILIHEKLHILEPEWSETKVLKHSKALAKLLWEKNYRRVNQ